MIVAGGLWGVGMWFFSWRRGLVGPLPGGTTEVAVAAALFVAVWFLSFLPFFVTSLYRISVVPVFLLAAAVGVVATVRLARSSRPIAALVGVAVLAVLWLVARVPVIAVDAGMTERLVLRGAQWRMHGDLVASEGEFREALRLTPESRAAKNGLAAVLLDTGRFADAAPLLEEAVQSNPEDPLLYFNLGLARLRLNDWAGAAGSLRRATELSPNLVEAHTLLGSSLEAVGDLRSAIDAYDRALSIDPEHLEANNNLAWLLATAPDAGLRDGERAVELARRSVAVLRVPATLDTLAAALAETGRFDEAVIVVEEAIRVSRQQRSASAGELEARRRMYRSGRPYRS
jgi:tetratricopeptide (TPR) repeat protein